MDLENCGVYVVNDRYISVSIDAAREMTRGAYNKFRGWLIPADENPDDEGYLVVRDGGYYTWEPKKSFEKRCRKVDGLTFGYAIEAAKHGKKIARSGWNGKGMFVFLREGRMITGVDSGTPMGGDFKSLPHLCMRTADGSCCVGWLASQSDIIGEDWMIVD